LKEFLAAIIRVLLGGIVSGEEMPSVERSRLAPARRALGLVVIMVLLGGAVAFYRAAPGFPSSPKPATTTRSVSPPVTSPASATPTVSASTPGGRPTNQSPDDRLPDGPGTTRPGIYLVATPASDGTFDVSELVRLDQPANSLELRVPPVASAGNDFRRLRPVALQVQADADGQPVMVPNGRIEDGVSVPLGTPSTRFELRYRLMGATVRTVGSVPGRAIAALTPVTAGVPDDLPVAIAATGPAVLNLTCPTLRLSEQACSTRRQGQLRAGRNLPWRQAVVLVQLDLPRP
jgi:hypothetical protein